MESCVRKKPANALPKHRHCRAGWQGRKVTSEAAVRQRGRISQNQGYCDTRHQLKFHICEAQHVRRRCVSWKCSSQSLHTVKITALYTVIDRVSFGSVKTSPILVLAFSSHFT